MNARRRSTASKQPDVVPEVVTRTRGKYIVVNGIEGSGKDTQIPLLAEALRARGHAVHITREPGGADLTARRLRRITQDPTYHINTKTEVMLYNAARAQSLALVEDMLARGVWVISNYNYLMTLAVQFYARNDDLAYEDILRICQFAVGDMEGDIRLLLDIPVDVALERKHQYGGGQRFDALSGEFLEKIRSGLMFEAKKRDYQIIDARGSVEDVSSRVLEAVGSFLQAPQKSKAAKVGDILAEKEVPYLPSPSEPKTLVEKQENRPPRITKSGTEWLQTRITNTDSNVYGFYDTLSPTTVAAAMARLSRRGDDMRVTLLDEFAQADQAKDIGLLKRVISAYGDDSVQQLVGTHLVVENASNLLTKKLEWGRLASYLEQSTRYIYFDQKDKRGNYKYFTPRTLDAKTAQLYENTLNNIFDTYSKIVRTVTEHVQAKSNVPKAQQDGAWRSATRAQACDAARSLLPVATKATVGIFASGQALESLIMHLMADPTEEAQTVGKQLLDEARKVIPVFLERADKPDRGGAFVAYKAETARDMASLAAGTLRSGYSTDYQPATLVDFWPKHELDILPHMLFEYSDASLEEIQASINTWSYEEKIRAFRTYMGKRLNRRQRPGRALEQAHYSWEIVCDYGIFRDLQRHRMVDDLQWQQLTPRYGYEVPELIEAAGCGDDFVSCFDQSLRLHSLMQQAGYILESQYATLLGHKLRWKIMYNARQAFHLHELRTTPQGHPGYRKLVKQMHDLLSEKHPLIGESMQFVNKDEDPALTRLAAERYTQWKLSKD